MFNVLIIYAIYSLGMAVWFLIAFIKELKNGNNNK
jgi:hypothetical protein